MELEDKNYYNNYGKYILMQVTVTTKYNINENLNESSSDLNKIIDEMSSLLMLNQVFKARELCASVIEEMKKKKESETIINDLLNRS